MSVRPQWIPFHESQLESWHGLIHESIQQNLDADFHPVMKSFQQLIDTDPVVRMYMTEMIQQIPKRYHHFRPKDLNNLLQQLNAALTIAPAYVPKGSGKEAVALVGCPITAILIWTMGTPAGFAAYRNEKINAMIKEYLTVWSGYLNSEASCSVLNDSPTGWMSPEAQAQLKMENYIYDPKAPHWGFKSWNDFFTREVKPGARPIDKPDDNKVVVAACDSTVYRVARDVKAQSEFWIKEQPYSLADMLCNEYVDEFVGGDVWQAFLSPFNYHRWHSPVSGIIKKAYVKEGLYFSQATSIGEDWTGQDQSEGYISQVQTRAIFFIEADDPRIGLVCVMPIGMVEISSCVINENIKMGARVEKGQEIGHFQFGGSTHCVIFRPGAIKEFTKTKNDEVLFGQTFAIAN